VDLRAIFDLMAGVGRREWRLVAGRSGGRAPLTAKGSRGGFPKRPKGSCREGEDAGTGRRSGSRPRKGAAYYRGPPSVAREAGPLEQVPERSAIKALFSSPGLSGEELRNGSRRSPRGRGRLLPDPC